MPSRLLLASFLLLAPFSLPAATPRLWSSKDGSATLTATFHKVEGGKVILTLPNGRSQVVDRQFLSDADLAWIAENTATAAAGAAPAAKIPAALAGKLIDDDGRPFAVAKDGAAPKYYLFYYSASWCGPCHAFTPELIRFSRRMKARQASLMVVLHPSDRSREDEIAYMKDMHMPWPGLDFDQRGSRDLPVSTWGYIPAMVLVDADGKRLLEVNDSVSKEEFLEKTEKILASPGDHPATTAN